MRVVLTPRALADIDDICDYVRDANPDAAFRLAGELRAALAILAAHPESGRSLRNRIRRFTTPRRPYLIFYRVDRRNGRVEVITIRHAARAPAPWTR